ncbi:hypothetical protein [Sinisalibacter aestuarii]|uniref:Uncharacterized protein n=1 Tax=Sinisalibacter aestuarii TaxID=2949426 RepID=A0ABQ5LTA4_9RHOB|nr:hypothetical protein [Sinisalibacter aestuarii]GKY87640.1 hypothetical protein STA1M1_15090 [Sinisalibacter aestuarii]
MLAIWTFIVLLVAGLATAMTLGWRRTTAQPVKQEQEICGPTCYPRVKR